MAINKAKQKSLKNNSGAVATKLGWVLPKTGELLVSIRGLPGAYDWDKKTNTFSKNGKVVTLGEKSKAPVEKVAKETETKPATKKTTKRATKKKTDNK